MLEPRPPRRDPRVLAILRVARGLAYAALDAWEVRGVGLVPLAKKRALRLALVRLVTQTRPTALVCAVPEAETIEPVAHRAGLPTVVLGRPEARRLVDQAPVLSEVRASYPELRALDIIHHEPVLRLAIASLTSLTLPHRKYAGFSTRSKARLASRRPRGRRPAPVSHRPPGRGARRSRSRRGR